MLREFDFHHFEWLDKKYYFDSIENARQKIIHDKHHEIIASDIDKNCIDMAIKNAKIA
jgi:23S rRNA G2445 N2-methylase RlmL